MANKMIIDASHPEETRVVVLRGNRVEEFDFESASKRPLRGNIYLAKVTRVEPSLQAAFIDYGGNRHGFLAFSEIHPDYYQIPVADRQALLEEEALSQREEDEEASGERRSRRHRRPRRPGGRSARRGQARRFRNLRSRMSLARSESASGHPFGECRGSSPRISSRGSPSCSPDGRSGGDKPGRDRRARGPMSPVEDRDDEAAADGAKPSDSAAPEAARRQLKVPSVAVDRRLNTSTPPDRGNAEPEERPLEEDVDEVTTLEGGSEERVATAKLRSEDEGEPVEQIGGDAMEEVPRRPQRSRRQYKIQEVIKRRQVLLVQVVKEERGNKGAALTTYLSLAGRYSVLMPNTARGGGISRKITNAQDRGRLKAIAEELDVPEGMGVILRTAGASRTKAEVKRDFEYLLQDVGDRAGDDARIERADARLRGRLAHQAGDPRSLQQGGRGDRRRGRNRLSRSQAVHAAPDAEPRQQRAALSRHPPVFAKAGVESQLDAMFSNQVTLKSGGYIVINQTEALVAIDVNSGRSTREHNIEDTALRTNLEAADEIARQLRLRDLAGLIVVDFIDMEESRNNRSVERRIKDALKNDRARIQVGRISHFGLLEMSRQRIRTGVLEGSTVVCPHCQGAGVVRSTASIALHVLRVLEDALIKSSTHDLTVRTRTPVALYILNQKRANLRDLERRFGVAIVVEADDTLTGANYHAIERGEPATGVKSEVGAGEIAGGRHHPDHRGSGDRSRQRMRRPSKRQARRMRRPRAASDRGGFSGRGRRRPATPTPPAPSRRRALVRRKRLAGRPAADGRRVGGRRRNRRRPPVRRVARATRSCGRGPRSEEERADAPGARAASETGSRVGRMEKAGPRRAAPALNSPPSLALEEEFAASEADYSPAAACGRRGFRSRADAGRTGAESRRAVAVEAGERGAERRQRRAESQSRLRLRRPNRPAPSAGVSAQRRAASAPPQRLVAAGARNRDRGIGSFAVVGSERPAAA